MESFSTRGLTGGRKVAFWNELASDTFAALDVRPRDIEQFHGSLQRERLGPLTVMNVCSSAVRIRHTRAHIGRMPMPSYLLLSPLEREMEISAEGASSIRVRAGEFCLIDHARTYDLRHGDSVRTFCVDIPRDRLEARLPAASQLVGRLMRPDSVSSKMLLALLRTLGSEVAHADNDAPGTMDSESLALGENLLSFVAATYSTCTLDGDSRGAQLRAKACRVYIESRLTDPGLTPAEVARHVGISERYLRAAFAIEGESFSSHVLRKRLERCAELLAEPTLRGRTITEIAFQAGFNNLTYFGQAFKARYGLTPREYRLTAFQYRPRHPTQPAR